MSRPEHLVMRTRRGLVVEVRRRSERFEVRPAGVLDHAWVPGSLGDLPHVLRTTMGLDEGEVREVIDRLHATGMA